MQLILLLLLSLSLEAAPAVDQTYELEVDDALSVPHVARRHRGPPIMVSQSVQVQLSQLSGDTDGPNQDQTVLWQPDLETSTAAARSFLERAGLDESQVVTLASALEERRGDATPTTTKNPHLQLLAKPRGVFDVACPRAYFGVL